MVSFPGLCVVQQVFNKFSSSKLPTIILAHTSIDYHVLYPQTDRAVHLLLETDSSSREYYTDALKYVPFRSPSGPGLPPRCPSLSLSLSPLATEPVWQPPSDPLVPLRARSNLWPPTSSLTLASWVSPSCFSLSLSRRGHLLGLNPSSPCFLSLSLVNLLGLKT